MIVHAVITPLLRYIGVVALPTLALDAVIAPEFLPKIFNLLAFHNPEAISIEEFSESLSDYAFLALEGFQEACPEIVFDFIIKIWLNLLNHQVADNFGGDDNLEDSENNIPTLSEILQYDFESDNER